MHPRGAFFLPIIVLQHLNNEQLLHNTKQSQKWTPAHVIAPLSAKAV